MEISFHTFDILEKKMLLKSSFLKGLAMDVNPMADPHPWEIDPPWVDLPYIRGSSFKKYFLLLCFYFIKVRVFKENQKYHLNEG